MKSIGTKKIRVLQAIRQGQIGGGETHVLSLVSRLNRSKFDPIVLSFTEGPMIEKLKELGIPCHVIPSTRPFDITIWKKVKSLLKLGNIDLVHVHGTRAASNLLWASKSSNIPILYTIHGWSYHDNQPIYIKRLRVLSENYLTKRMDVNISVSQSNYQTGRENFCDFKSIVINNGIDFKKFNPHRQLTDIRIPLNIPGDSLLVTYIARMTEQKAPLIMLQAFKLVTKECPDAFLLMVGEGELRKRAEMTAEKLGIKHRVAFENFRTDIPEILQSSDIYCLPSLWEGLPIGLLEAMAMNKAVIASKVDGSKEIIKDNKNGLLINPGSVTELSQAIIRLCKSSDTRLQFQSISRETIFDKYSLDKMTDNISTLYSTVMTKT